MKTHQSKIEKLIAKLCPNEVEWKTLGDICVIKTGQPVNKRVISDNPGEYPVINSGREPLGFINKWNTDNDPIGITTRGVGVGSITWQAGKYFRGNLNYSVSIKSTSQIHIRYLYYLLLEMHSEIQSLCTFDGIPALNAGRLKELKIPLPPLPIQKEIVRILDTFTELTTQLTTELTTRKKQYSYYRDKLLAFEEDEVEWKPLGAIVNNVTAPMKLKKEAYREIGATPIIDQGFSFITGYTDEDVKVLPADEYIIFGDHSEHIKYVDFAFIQGADGLKILKPKLDSAKYVYHAFQNFYKKELNYKRHWSKAKDTLIPIPPFIIQKEIVSILDKFDTLTHSISEGLPREIALRQKQYEYYREKLLNFPQFPSSGGVSGEA